MDQLVQAVAIDPISLVMIVLRTVVVYIVLLLALRLAGKRELGQMTPFDLVVLLIIANAVQTAMVGPDTTLTGGLVAAFVLLGVNRLVDRLGLRSTRVRHVLIGTPTLLVHDGQLVQANLVREGILEDEVLEALREHGVDSPVNVKLAVLEVDGSISVVPMSDEHITRTRHQHPRPQAHDLTFTPRAASCQWSRAAPSRRARRRRARAETFARSAAATDQPRLHGAPGAAARAESQRPVDRHD